jgi:hypothetical protein
MTRAPRRALCLRGHGRPSAGGSTGRPPPKRAREPLVTVTRRPPLGVSSKR